MEQSPNNFRFALKKIREMSVSDNKSVHLLKSLKQIRKKTLTLPDSGSKRFADEKDNF